MAKPFSEVFQNIKPDLSDELSEKVKEPSGKLKDACWKGYTAVGMKMKDGRKVPNCVPVGEQFASDKPEPGREAVGGRFTSQASKPVQRITPQATPKVSEAKEEQEYDYEGDMAMSDLRSILHNAKQIHDMLEPKTNMPEWCQSKITLAEDYLSTVANYLRGEMNEEVEQIEEMPGANMDTLAVHKHLRKSGWSLTRTKGGHDVYTHPKSEKHIAVPRHRQLKAPLVRGIMKDAQVSEDIEQIEEISQQTKQSYVQKAKDQVKELEPHAKSGEYRDIAKNMINRREKGITMASEAKNSAMSRAKDIAKTASKKKVLEQDNNNQVDNVRTPAKQSLAFRGVVKNMEKPTKSKKTNDDKFEAEPELNTQIMRNN